MGTVRTYVAGVEGAKGRNIGGVGGHNLEARACHAFQAIIRTLVFNEITLAAVLRMTHCREDRIWDTS